MVLAVGNEDDDAAVALGRLAREGEQRLLEGLAHGRTLHVGQRGVDAPRKGLGHAVVRGNGELHLRLAGEDDEPHAVLLQPVEELVDGILGPLEAVGFEVLGQHRVRDVDHEHHLDALALLLAELRAQLRACGGEDEQRERRAEEDELQLHAPGRDVGH